MAKQTDRGKDRSIRDRIGTQMKYQRNIWIPEEDNYTRWSRGFESREYKKLNLSGQVCLDIGAHVGIWTKRLATDFNEVIAFEPLTKHIECHKKNTEECDNVTLHEVALSDESITTEMTTRKFNSGMSSLLTTRKFKDGYKLTVETKTLDSFDFPKIDFIKMDVEGYEEKVIAGGMNTILKHLPKIYMEIWPKNLNSMTELMNGMGYSVNQVSETNYLCEHTTE